MSVDTQSKNLFDKFFGINVTLLKVGGTLGSKRYSLKNPTGLITLVCLFIWGFLEWYAVIIQFQVDKEQTIQNVTSIFSGYLATTKGLSLIFQGNNIRNILQRLSEMWDCKYMEEKNRTIMFTMARVSYRTTFFYSILCLLISAVFHFQPYKKLLDQFIWTKNFNNTYNLTTIWPLTYPVEINYVGNYIPVMIVEHMMVIFFLIYLISSDTLFCQLMTHLCLHFQLLRHDLENIIDEATPIGMSDKEERAALQKLSSIIKTQNELYLLSERVEKIFQPIFFASMLVTSLILCMALYQIKKLIMIGQFLEGLAQMSHGLVLFAEVAIYCGYSNMLSNETELLAKAAYSSPWPFLGRRFCCQLQLLMFRSQKAFCCRAYGLFRLDLPQLSTIVSTAATYFTLLNTLVKKK